VPIPPEATIVEARTFAQLSQIIRGQMEYELHRRPRPPAALRVYINLGMASDARKPEGGTAMIAWAQAQGVREVSIRLDETGDLLREPACAYWLRWD